MTGRVVSGDEMSQNILEKREALRDSMLQRPLRMCLGVVWHIRNSNLIRQDNDISSLMPSPVRAALHVPSYLSSNANLDFMQV